MLYIGRIDFFFLLFKNIFVLSSMPILQVKIIFFNIIVFLCIRYYIINYFLRCRFLLYDQKIARVVISTNLRK